MNTIEEIKKVMEKIRPYLNSEGGDLEFLGFKDGIVYVRMLGACADCGMLDITLADGIEDMLKEKIPAVIGVKNIIDPEDPILNDLEK